MSSSWTNLIACFQQADGHIVGAGVLTVNDLVLTCAHVVREALKGSRANPEKEAELTVSFPFAG